MRNHSKVDKEKTSKPTLRPKVSKRPTPTYDTHSAVLKKIKNMTTTDQTPMECTESAAITTGAAASQECIFLDAGSKKSYIDLTESKAAAAESYSRISVIRTVGSQSPPALKNDQFEFYQEKPVDFSPKHKYKTDCSTNGGKNLPLSNQYTTMVV